MPNDESKLSEDARVATGFAWFDFLEQVDPCRGELFRYCRKLTGEVWDAEDLVQDTLEQSFARFASVHHNISNPRAFLFRIASNLWIDRSRRRQTESALIAREMSDATVRDSAQPGERDGVAMRDAGALMLRELAPQERAAFLLKEGFELSLDEIAEILGTTSGAVKSALHRGRERFRDGREEPLLVSHPRVGDSEPVGSVIAQFVARYNARDLRGMLDLMLDNAAIEMYGHVYDVGRESFERPGNWFHHNFYNPWDGSPTDARWEVVDFRGEAIALVLYPQVGQQEDDAAYVVGSVMRIEEQQGAVARLRVYSLCPDVVEEVALELGRTPGPVRMYRFPFRDRA